jgi:hypothetical protein
MWFATRKGPNETLFMSNNHPYATESAPTLDIDGTSRNRLASRSTGAAPGNLAPEADRLDSGFTVSARTVRGRLLITIDRDALKKLERPGVDASLLSVLARHMPRFHALALQMAADHGVNHVVIEAKDIHWTDDEIDCKPDIRNT